MTRDEMHQRDDRIALLTYEGLPVKAICEIFRVTERTVNRARRRTKCAKGNGKPFTQDEILKIETMFQDGCSYGEIGRTINRASSSIKRRWPGRGWTQEQVNEYLSLIRTFKEYVR